MYSSNCKIWIKREWCTLNNTNPNFIPQHQQNNNNNNNNNSNNNKNKKLYKDKDKTNKEESKNKYKTRKRISISIKIRISIRRRSNHTSYHNKILTQQGTPSSSNRCLISKATGLLSQL